MAEMGLKEEMELVRGVPIRTRLPVSEIPCNETSDPEKLCKAPVVSVFMLTYNHEPFIAKAIDSVMMQKTDFDFELVIGEDASTDRTREICFEYQKRFPDKIRVLWSEKNVYKIGGNGIRTFYRCGGEFLAICEGDDYWTDPLKLQKQVDIMRSYPKVNICYTRFQEMSLKGNAPAKVLPGGQCEPGLIPQADFFMRSLGMGTQTILLRTQKNRELHQNLEILSWVLTVADLAFSLAMATIGDAYLLPDVTAVHRLNETSTMVREGNQVHRDAACILLYFKRKFFDLVGDKEGYNQLLEKFLIHCTDCRLFLAARMPTRREKVAEIKRIEQCADLKSSFTTWHKILFFLTRLGLLNPYTVKQTKKMSRSIQRHLLKKQPV